MVHVHIIISCTGFSFLLDSKLNLTLFCGTVECMIISLKERKIKFEPCKDKIEPQHSIAYSFPSVSAKGPTI